MDNIKSTDMYRQEGEVRSDLYCHSCTKVFIALINYSVDGQHCIECSYCAHQHYRTIKDGYVTSERYNSDNSNTPDIRPRKTWKSDVIAAETTTASWFLRDKWLNRSSD